MRQVLPQSGPVFRIELVDNYRFHLSHSHSNRPKRFPNGFTLQSTRFHRKAKHRRRQQTIPRSSSHPMFVFEGFGWKLKICLKCWIEGLTDDGFRNAVRTCFDRGGLHAGIVFHADFYTPASQSARERTIMYC